jgi:hypothetical protein
VVGHWVCLTCYLPGSGRGVCCPGRRRRRVLPGACSATQGRSGRLCGGCCVVAAWAMVMGGCVWVCGHHVCRRRRHPRASHGDWKMHLRADAHLPQAPSWPIPLFAFACSRSTRRTFLPSLSCCLLRSCHAHVSLFDFCAGPVKKSVAIRPMSNAVAFVYALDPLNSAPVGTYPHFWLEPCICPATRALRMSDQSDSRLAESCGFTLTRIIVLLEIQIDVWLSRHCCQTQQNHRFSAEPRTEHS